jgi:hyperosmotically inducible protein
MSALCRLAHGLHGVYPVMMSAKGRCQGTMPGRDENQAIVDHGSTEVKRIKYLSTAAAALVLLLSLGCAATSTQESTGEYLDDSYITAKVKTAIFKESSLKSSEINVETFKGTVQLSGFVNSQEDIDKALAVAGTIQGVKSVKNDMRVK